MRWLQDRRGYGELRLPYARRQHRRASWLDQDLRHRRRELLSSRWPELTKIVVAFAAADLSLAYAARHEPLLQGGLVGVFLGAVTVFMAVLLALADGSLLARLGRMIEGDVGDELRTTRGVYGVISGVSFERVDVDHVVLTPKGCYAVEVKALFGRRQPLADTYGLQLKLAQANAGAQKIHHLLHDMNLHVKPVLVLAGPGAPHLDGRVVICDGVLVVAFRDSDMWRPNMAEASDAVPLTVAAVAAARLRSYCDQRDQHRRAAARRRRWRTESSRTPDGREITPAVSAAGSSRLEGTGATGSNEVDGMRRGGQPG